MRVPEALLRLVERLPTVILCEFDSLFQGLKRKFDILPPPPMASAVLSVDAAAKPLLPTLTSLIVTFDCKKVQNFINLDFCPRRNLQFRGGL